jgi:hypothetical protein
LKKKTDFILKLIAEVEPRFPFPKKNDRQRPLIETVVVLALMRHLTETQAEASLKAFKAAYVDWNEVRVSQVQELAQCIRTSSRKKGTALLNEHREVCMTLKTLLQEVFQQTHGLDIEYLRGEEVDDTKLLFEKATALGATTLGYLLWCAYDGKPPVHPGLVKLLDKFDLMTRTSSMKKAREALDALVPKGKELEFTIAFHHVLEHWDDPERPSFAELETLRGVPFGKKTFEDWQSSKARAEVAAAREEERRLKEEERERKRLEAEEKKLQAIEEKKRKSAAAKKERERKRVQAETRRAQGTSEKASAAKKSKSTSVAKTATKKAPAKQAPAKKTAAKKPAAKTSASKPAAAKKPVSTKAPAKKAGAKKSATKAAATKSSSKTGGAKKPAAKKKAVKKSASKATKKTAKKTTKKTPRRR